MSLILTCHYTNPRGFPHQYVLRGLSQPEVNAYITRFQGGRYIVTEEKEN